MKYSLIMFADQRLGFFELWAAARATDATAVSLTAIPFSGVWSTWLTSCASAAPVLSSVEVIVELSVFGVVTFETKDARRLPLEHRRPYSRQPRVQQTPQPEVIAHGVDADPDPVSCSEKFVASFPLG